MVWVQSKGIYKKGRPVIKVVFIDNNNFGIIVIIWKILLINWVQKRKMEQSSSSGHCKYVYKIVIKKSKKKLTVRYEHGEKAAQKKNRKKNEKTCRQKPTKLWFETTQIWLTSFLWKTEENTLSGRKRQYYSKNFNIFFTVINKSIEFHSATGPRRALCATLWFKESHVILDENKQPDLT